MQYFFFPVSVVLVAFLCGADPVCNLCSTDELLRPNESVPSEDRSCGDINQEGKDGMIAANRCTFIQSTIGEFCCSSSTSSPTTVNRTSPSSLAPFSLNNEVKNCPICGIGKIVTLPDAAFYYDKTGATNSCGFLDANGLGGSTGIPHEVCPDLPDILKDICGCVQLHHSTIINDIPSTTILQEETALSSSSIPNKKRHHTISLVVLFVLLVLIIATTTTAIVKLKNMKKELSVKVQTTNISITINDAENSNTTPREII